MWTQGQEALRAIANIAQSQSDSSLVTGVTGRKIQVLAVAAVAGGTATDVTFKSKPSGSSAAVSPLFALGANGSTVLPFNPAGWFETVAGEALTATTGAGATTGILVVYTLV